EWPAHRLPAGATVHARIHTKYPSGWVNSSIEFTVRPVAIFSGLVPEATISPIHTFKWTSVQGAEAYYLYLGSSPGLRDYVDTGETMATSFQAVGLPAGRTVYGRLHTKHGGAWRFVDMTVNVAPVATFI